MPDIRLTSVRVYEQKEELILSEHAGKINERIVKKPKMVLHRDLDKGINLRELRAERLSYRTILILFTLPTSENDSIF